MTTRQLQTAFTSGEIAPQLIGRTDDNGYKSGAYKLENFIVLPQGAIRSRPGFQYVAKAKDNDYPVRLIPFRFASDQTLVLVFGNYTMCIITEGKEVLNADGSVYQISTPYSANDLKQLDYCQNADIITFTSHYTVPYELVRYSALDWRFRQVSVSPTILPPSSVEVSAVYASRLSEEEEKDKNKLEVKYVVTALNENNYESIASKPVSGTGNYYINGCKIRVSWNGVNEASRYRVYRYTSGIYGYVGETSDTYLEDIGDNPDTSTTPPKYKEVFSGSSSGISAINITNTGSGYTVSNTSDVYLPEFINISMIPPLWTLFSYLRDQNYFEAVYLDIISADDSSIIKSFSLDFVTDIVSAEDKNRVRVCYLKNSGTSRRIYLNLSKKIKEVKFKIRAVTTKGSGSEMATAKLISKDTLGTYPTINIVSGSTYNNSDVWNAVNADIQQFYTSGYTFNELINVFGSADISLKYQLTISSSTGSGAVAYAYAINGQLLRTEVVEHGVNYKDATVTLNEASGSGATFSAVLSSSVLPDLPSAVTQYDQRRVFAGSEQNPLRVWLTNAGYQDLMQYHQPVMSDDRIIIDAVTSDADRIRHAVALDSLLLFTGSSELRVYTQNSDALSPSSVAVRAQSYIGSAYAQPVILNNQVLFAGNHGGHIYAMGYQNSASSYVSQNISIRSSHLFDNREVKSLALAKSPVQELWVVTDEGVLLGCTLYIDQSVIAWHRHTTQGLFEDVCVVSEGNEEHLYAVIKRDGIRFIERMSNITVGELAKNYRYLDCYAEGEFDTPTKTVTGLSYLEGKTVGVFADGKTQTNKVVKDGQITLDVEAKNIAVGLPYTCTLETVPLIAQAEGALQGRVKNISELYLRVSYNGDLYANNLNATKLYKIKKDDVYMKPHNTKGYVVKVSTDGSWDYDAQLKVEHRDCAPIEIASVVTNFTVEDGK